VGTSYLQLDSGLVIPQERAGWASVAAALKQHDPHLELGQVDGVWKVYYRTSPDRPAEFLTDWRDPDGTPRELSHGLVDQVRGQDRNSRGKRPNADELNAQRQEELQKHRERVAEALVDDTTFKHGRPILPRSRTLMRARHKSGYHDWKV
jgi:hypothetical protein